MLHRRLNDMLILPLLGLVLLLPATETLVQIVGLCDRRRGLTAEQQSLCREHEGHMAYILDGGRLALDECKRKFEGQRWNCTFPRLKLPRFLHPMMSEANRETAFVHAIIAAGAMHAVSRACMESKLEAFCRCSLEDRPSNLPSAYTWGGCGDNLPYGYYFSKKFIDAKEEIAPDNVDSFASVLMNLHNNEAGRVALGRKSKIQCRCHGVSKNCATKFCYRQLANFNEVGDYLHDLHQSSLKVRLAQNTGSDQTEMKLVETESDYRKYSPADLVYIKDSPSYCAKNLSVGSFGVEGRQCKANSNTLNDCNVLCCGNGHLTKRQIVKEKCECKFVWCCEVRCQTCESEQNVHYCK